MNRIVALPGLAGYFNFDSERSIVHEVIERMASRISPVGASDSITVDADRIALMRSPRITSEVKTFTSSSRIDDGVRGTFFGRLSNAHQICDALGIVHDEATPVDLDALVLRGYQEWGIETLCRRLVGSFAFCIIDTAEDRIIVARDRVGTVPVFYSNRYRQAAFATNMRALIASGLVNPKLNQGALIGYLAHGFSIGDDTLLTGARRLPIGHFLEWQGGELSVNSYLDDGESVRENVNRPKLVESLRTTLWDCVEEQASRHDNPVVADDRTGVAPAICTMIAKARSASTPTCTLSFSDRRHLESAGRGDVVDEDQSQTRNHVNIDAMDFESVVELLAESLDEPTANTEVVLHAALASKLADEFDALVSTFGIESFIEPPKTGRPTGTPASYGLHEAQLQRDWLEISHGIGVRLNCTVMPLPRVETVSETTGHTYQLDIATIWNLLGTAQRPSMDLIKSHLAEVESTAVGEINNEAPDLVAQKFDSRRRWSQSLFQHVAAIENASGMVLNSPFVDQRLLSLTEQVRAIDSADGANAILVDALSEYLPAGEEISASARPTLPMFDWMRGSLQSWVRRRLLEGSLIKHRIIDEQGVNSILLAQGEVGLDLSQPIGSLICLDCWYQSILEAFPKREAVSDSPLDLVDIDPNSYLAATIEDEADKPDDIIDIVMPVYGGLNYVKDAVRSIVRHTSVPFRLIVVDDSDCDVTYAALEEIADWDARIELLRNETNLGFVKTANRGMQAATSKYVCLINSDIIVTEGWLSRMLRCAESDERIAAVNPMSNMCVNLSVAMAPGLNLNTMSRRLSQVSRRDYPDITTAVGYCMLIRRKWLRFLGCFDEIFGAGYCEESDFCMRLTEEGLRIVAAEDAFVYHKGSGSFGTWIERYRKNRVIFDQRWAFAYQRDYDEFLKRNPLQYVRDALLRNTIDYDEWSLPTTLAWDRFDRDQLERRGRSFARGDQTLGSNTTAGSFVRHIGRRPRTNLDPSQRRVRFPTRSYIDRIPDLDRMRITFLIAESMPICGGVICITQLAREMLIAGHDVKIVTLADVVDPEKFNLPTQPLVYPSNEEMIRLFPPSDIVIATYWTTAFHIMPKLRQRYDFVSSYYVQDYEAYFYPEDEFVVRAQAASTYTMTEYRVVMSQWLKQLIERKHGVACHKIHMGLDLGVFRPRSAKADANLRPQIVYNARPDAPRRGFSDAIKAFERVHAERPDVEFVFFGTENKDMPDDLPIPFTNLERIYDPNKVAQMLSDATLLLDSSHFQGFGRPGLEAMACGTPPVLTNEGGVNEYAVDNQNALMVSPRDHQAMADRMLMLLNDSTLAARLREGGLKTAQDYCHMDEARIHMEMYESWIARKYGLSSDTPNADASSILSE